MYFPGLGYAEILRRVNLDTLNVRLDSICQKYFDKIKVGTHRLNYLLPDKKRTEYNIRQQNVYPLPVIRRNIFRNKMYKLYFNTNKSAMAVPFTCV